MAQKMKVTYLDGEEIVAVASARAQVETERHLKGFTDVTLVEAGYRLAFEALRARKQLSRPDLGYEEWLDNVDDVQEVETEEPEAVDPTNEGQSPTPSSD